MAPAYSAWIATLKASRRGHTDGSFGRSSERVLHAAKLDEIIAFIERCEKQKAVITVVLGLSNGPQQ